MSTELEIGTFAESRETIRRLATDAFKDHVLAAEGDGRWLAKRADSGAYWFRVITAPGSLIALGDVGELILRPHCKQDQIMSWLRGAVDSSGYFAEKVQASKEPPKAFYPAECMRWMARYVAEYDYGKERKRQLRQALYEMREEYRDGNLYREKWLEIAHEHGIDDIYHVGMGLSSNMLWMIELCRCFVRLHDEEQARKAVAA